VKKVIPQKVANKVYNKLLSENQNRVEGQYPEDILFKPETNKLNHRFFKNNIGNFIYKGGWSSKRKRYYIKLKKYLNIIQEKLNDYLQEK